MTFGNPIHRDQPRTPSRGFRSAFTLVELLVVIGIIALLISLLLPALNKARKSAINVKCESNIKQLLYAMRIYASDNKDSIPGSGWTSSRFIYSDAYNSVYASDSTGTAFSTNNLPQRITNQDWMTPLALITNPKLFNQPNSSGTYSPSLLDSGDNASRALRYQIMRDYGTFKCPANEYVSIPYSGSTAKFTTGPMLSYVAAVGFLLEHNYTKPTYSGYGYMLDYPGEYDLPPTYNVTISKVGDPSQKIFIADGATGVSYSAATAPSMNLSLQSSSALTDVGACFTATYSWPRATVAGVRTTVSPDPRLYAYRHGTTVSGASADQYRMNAGFFDGHVQSLGDLQSTNPTYWYPRGTKITFKATYTTFAADTAAIYNPGGAPTFMVP